MERKKASFDDVMAAAGNGRRRTSALVCFSRELNSRYDELQLELEQAVRLEHSRESQPQTSRRSSDNPRSVELAQQIADLIEGSPEAFYELEFEQASRADWRRLRSQHPPRDGVAADNGLFNSDTFGPEAIKLCLVDPEPTPERFAYMHDVLSEGEWERLTLVVWELNEGARPAPKVSPMASLVLSGSATK